MTVNPAPLILPYRGVMPRIDPSAFIAPGAVVIGDVEIGAESSVWPGCILRGDVNIIRIGARTNIQDGTVVHVAAEGQGTHLGDEVTVGHMALLHDCAVDSHGFVGMKSAVMDGAKIESRAMLAAGALLTPGKVVPTGQLWAGSPAKHWRDLNDGDKRQFDLRAGQYVELARSYRYSGGGR
jgi:carbonic anhydrase/acetyltransferase-like protein (isoleucine patch superfamily)